MNGCWAWSHEWGPWQRVVRRKSRGPAATRLPLYYSHVERRSSWFGLFHYEVKVTPIFRECQRCGGTEALDIVRPA